MELTGLTYSKRLDEVRSFRATVYCPRDDEELEATGYMLTSAPPQFPHKCQRCGYSVNLDASYPRIEYR